MSTQSLPAAASPVPRAASLAIATNASAIVFFIPPAFASLSASVRARTACSRRCALSCGRIQSRNR